jgi:hypothetical protein
VRDDVLSYCWYGWRLCAGVRILARINTSVWAHQSNFNEPWDSPTSSWSPPKTHSLCLCFEGSITYWR